MNPKSGDILIVDDIPANLKILAAVLIREGYKIRPANNGAMALKAVQASIPDLILLDVNMPDIDGFTVCRQLKLDPKSHDIPVIFISALDGTQEKVKGFEAGGVDYITKPFEPEEVLARVSTHLSLRLLQKQLQDTNRELEIEISIRLHAEEELRRRQQILTTLNAITRTAAVSVDFQEMVQIFADQLGNLFNADSCYITRWDRPNGVTIPLAAYGPLRETYSNLQAETREAQPYESVLRTGRALAVDDVTSTPSIELLLTTNVHCASALALPLITSGKVNNAANCPLLGVILVLFDKAHQFSPDEIALGEQTAGQIALAIAKANLLKDATHRASEFAALYETAQATAGEVTLAVLLPLIMERALYLVSAKAGVMYLYDAAHQEFEVAASTEGIIQKDTRIKNSSSLSGINEPERQSLIIDDYPEWQAKNPNYPLLPFKAAVSVPLLFSGELIGVLHVFEMGTSSRKFTQEDAQLLLLFGTHAAAAVHSAHLFSEARTHLGEINRLSTVLRAAATTDDMLPKFLDETLAVLHTNDGGIWLFNGPNKILKSAVMRGMMTMYTNYDFNEKGLTYQRIRGHNHLVSREVSADARINENVRAHIPPGKGGVMIPIRAANEEFGIIMVAVNLPREIQPEEIRFLTTLAEMVGDAMHRMRQHQLTTRRNNDLNALRDIDRAIGGSLDVNITLGILLEQTLARLNIDAASVLLFKPDKNILEFAAGRGFLTDALQHTRLRMGEGYAGRAALERRVVHTPNLRGRQTDFLRSPTFYEEGFVSAFSVPLLAKGQIKGVFEVFHRSPHDPDPDWMETLNSLAIQAAIALDNADLFEGLQRSNMELSMAYETTIEGWAHALDLREHETGAHSKRVTEITEQLARVMGMSEFQLGHIRRGALLHDIGKMGVPDSVLLKPGKLDDEEWGLMRQHPVYAFNMLSPITYLRPALDIPHYHHEKWDGTGYPQSLKGNDIPLAARIFSVVDVWDALTSDRPYRPAMEPEKALEYISNQAGLSFDPNVIDQFVPLINRLLAAHS